MQDFDKVEIILSNTSHPGNIGSVARAMKTMGFSRLTLVNACNHLDDVAIAMASGAHDILENAKVVATLPEALADLTYVLGTSARTRSLPWPLLKPKKAAEVVRDEVVKGQVGLLFGSEKFGLSNEELQLCQSHITIPTSETFQSLNLSQAVQVLVYECRMALSTEQASSDIVLERDAPLATHQEFEGFMSQMSETLADIGFLNPKQPKLLLARLRRLYQRAELDKKEVNILRGMLSAIEKRELAKENE